MLDTVQVEILSGGEVDGIKEDDMFEVSDPEEEEQIYEVRKPS